MRLLTALKTIQYDRSWGIWAEKINGRFTPESYARFGQRHFENGGISDGYEYVCNGEYFADYDGDEIDIFYDLNS